MISFDLECKNGHRFEGVFKDYSCYCDQLKKEQIRCPLCRNKDIKTLFTGCSIQTKNRNPQTSEKQKNIFETIRLLKRYVSTNFENVGKEFPEVARAIYYGNEEERNIYGESTPEETRDLIEEGIDILPLPDLDKIEN